MVKRPSDIFRIFFPPEIKKKNTLTDSGKINTLYKLGILKFLHNFLLHLFLE